MYLPMVISVGSPSSYVKDRRRACALALLVCLAIDLPPDPSAALAQYT